MRVIAALALLVAGPATAQRFVLDGPGAIPATRVFADGYGFDPADPHRFSIALPEGTYRVTVTLGGKRATETTIKAENRRLMLDAVRTRTDERVTRTFVVDTRTPALATPPPGAPGAGAVRLYPREIGSPNWDDRLTLEILGDRPGVTAIEVAPAVVRTVFLLGDSTVTDRQYEPAASWGQMLPAFVGSDISVANYAESGETLKSFLAELRLDKILARARPGDVALIQFGHNDQKANWPQTHAPAATTYRDYLRTYIAELRRVGVQPVLVTSPERRNWTGARIRPTLSDYAEAVRAVAKAEGVPLIDLNAASIVFYEALGPARAPLAFKDDGRDATHHNAYGAWVLARIVADGLRASGLPIARAMPVAPFDPAKPPAPETFRLAPSAAQATTE